MSAEGSWRSVEPGIRATSAPNSPYPLRFHT